MVLNKDLMEVISEQTPKVAGKPMICESCGDEFGCGAELKSCWCMDLKLTDETRADIKTRFETCLCKKCLEKVSTEQH